MAHFTFKFGASEAYFFIYIFLSSFVIQSLLFGKIVAVFFLYTHKEMFEDTVFTCSLILLEGARRLSQSVQSPKTLSEPKDTN